MRVGCTAAPPAQIFERRPATDATGLVWARALPGGYEFNVLD